MTASPAPRTRAIRVQGLAVRRGERTLFEGLDFVVEAGEALLLRGPNGSGKTSLLLTLFGAIRPEAGRIVFDGVDAEARRETEVHLVGHRPAVKARLTVAENLGFWAAVNGASGETVETALDTVGIGGLGDADAGHLSAGQTRRLALARLLVSKRDIWLLDEPTAALDAEGEALVAHLIDAHCAGGGIVVAATHHDIPLSATVRTTTLGGVT
jgi:heme exporter protein A